LAKGNGAYGRALAKVLTSSLRDMLYREQDFAEEGEPNERAARSRFKGRTQA
jgi:hypothetical protein